MSTALQRFSRKNQSNLKNRKPNNSFQSPVNNRTRIHSNNTSLIFSRLKSNSIPFEIPNLTPRLLAKEQDTLNNIYKQRKFNSRHQYELKPLKRPEPIRLLRPLFGSNSLNEIKMPSSRPRITDQYQYQIENIKLVERLLSVKPSKQVCKSEQLLAYKQHKKNVAFLEHKKGVSCSVTRKKKKQWVDI